MKRFCKAVEIVEGNKKDRDTRVTVNTLASRKSSDMNEHSLTPFLAGTEEFDLGVPLPKRTGLHKVNGLFKI